MVPLSSQRITFAKGDLMIRQNEVGEAAYVVLSGDVEIVIGEGADEMVLVKKGKNTLLERIELA